LEANELELVDLSLDYEHLRRLLLNPRLLKLNLTNVSWTAENASSKVKLPDLENFAYHGQGKAISNIEALNAIFPFHVDWNSNSLNLDILIWDNDILSDSESGLERIVRTRSRFVQSQDGILVSNLPFTDNLLNEEYRFEMDLKILRLYNCPMSSAFLPTLTNLEELVLHNVTLGKKLSRDFSSFLQQNPRLKYLQIFQLLPANNEYVRIPIRIGMDLLGLGENLKAYFVEGALKSSFGPRATVDRLYVSNCQAWRREAEIYVSEYLVAECWDLSEEVINILSEWIYSKSLLIRTEKDSRFMLYRKVSRSVLSHYWSRRELTQAEFYLSRRDALRSKHDEDLESVRRINENNIIHRNYSFDGGVSKETQDCPLSGKRLPPPDRCSDARITFAIIQNAVLDPKELSIFLRSSRMRSLVTLELVYICIHKFIPVPMPNVKNYRLLLREQSRKYNGILNNFKYGFSENEQVQTFPFAYDGGVLDLHRLGINIDIQTYKPETKALYSMIRLDPNLGEVHYGDFGGFQVGTLRFGDGTNYLVPLKHLSLYRQKIDCKDLMSLNLLSLEQLELYRTKFVNGTLGMLLGKMRNLDRLFLNTALEEQPDGDVSIFDFPQNLRHLFLASYWSSYHGKFSRSIPRFEKMEVLGWRGLSDLNLNFRTVFPKLKLCFLGIEPLAVVQGILGIQTIEKLLVFGVKEYRNSKMSVVMFL
jgi:hypothetical protein